MMLLYGGRLHQTTTRRDGEELLGEEPVKALKGKDEKLTMKTISKLSLQHEELLEELKRTRKKLREELQRTKDLNQLESEEEETTSDFVEKVSTTLELGKSLLPGEYVSDQFNKTAGFEGTEGPFSNSNQKNDPLSESVSPVNLPMLNNYVSSPNKDKYLRGAKDILSPKKLNPKSPAKKLPHGAKAKLDLLPILTNTGETAFEVGLNASTAATNELTRTHIFEDLYSKNNQNTNFNFFDPAGGSLQSQVGEEANEDWLQTMNNGGQSKAKENHLMPVFRLPTVVTTQFVNRIPRDDNTNQGKIREREEEEMQIMEKNLGIPRSEIREIEVMLGLRDPKSNGHARINEVKTFMNRQLDVNPVRKAFKRMKETNSDSYDTKNNFSQTVTKFNSNNAAGDIEELLNNLNNGVATNDFYLSEKRKNGTSELRNELAMSIQQMISSSTAIKYDVMSIRSICPIRNPRAKSFLKVWAAEKLFTLMENLMFSVVVISFERWKQKVEVIKKMQRISNYLKFQSSQRLRQWVESWIGKNLAGAFHTWANEIKAQKLMEYKAAELKAAKLVQRVFRGHRGRGRANLLFTLKKSLQQRKAAIKIQSLIRGFLVRKDVSEIIRKKTEFDAAVKVQSLARGVAARKKFLAMKRKAAKSFVVLKLQCLYRGNQARKLVEQKKHDKIRNEAAFKIQKMARMKAAKNLLARLKHLAIREKAAIVIQSEIRACLARVYVEKLRRERTALLIRQEKAALIVQRTYRGHKARAHFRYLLRAHRKKQEETRLAATHIQRMIRGFVARAVVGRMRKEAWEALLEDARLWKEQWNEQEMKWAYTSSKSTDGEAIWEPPKTGYTKADGMLVLATGKVVEDPDAKLSAEEKEDKRLLKLCVECEKRDASRFCRQCNDKYCGPCYNKVHAYGKRAGHSYAQIGPMECSECESEVATKWCTSCDDPFCKDCWNLIHLRGKRKAHCYLEIDRRGKVSQQLMNRNGEPTGEYDTAVGPQDLGGYDEDAYGVTDYEVGKAFEKIEAYDSDYGGAEELQVEDQAIEEWTQYYDGGIPYWYNNLNGETTWEDPTGGGDQSNNNNNTTKKGATDYGSDYAKYDGYDSATAENYGYDQNQEEWTTYQDETGVTYYYNNLTGATQYEQPNLGTKSQNEGYVQGGSSVWQEYQDEQGYTYYYNSDTGESTYEKPLGV